MRNRRFAVGLGLVFLLGGTWAVGDVPSSRNQEALQLVAGQKEFLTLEPILVTVRLDSGQVDRLPAAPGQGKEAVLRFEVDPPLKPRSGARPLPLEGQAADAKVQARLFDLSEWLVFPDKGTWKIRAVIAHKGGKLVSSPIAVTLRRPAKEDAEVAAVARIHHVPWTNYDTNAFCGDTFDLVKQWPSSQLARYCHYWNGRFSQNKKEYDKAIASYRIVLEKYADFALAEHAEFGIVECLCATKNLKEAQKLNTALRQKLDDRAAKSRTGKSVVRQLAQQMSERLNRDLGVE